MVHALVELARSVARGGGGVALVTGAAGIGKSTVVRHALDRIATASPAVAVSSGWCTEQEGAPPLWVWRQALEVLDGPEDADLRAALTGDYEPPPDPEGAAVARFERLANVARMLAQAVQRRPAVLVLEDLHWADAASLALLELVASWAGRRPVLVIVTSRDHALESGLSRYPSVTALQLPPLTPSEVAAVLRLSGAGDLEPARVHRRTGGLPLLVEAAARQATADPAADPTADLALIADSLIAQIPGPLREIVRTAALLEDVDAALVGEICDVPVGTVLRALGAGSRSGLLTRGPTDGSYRFVHSLLQEGLRNTIPLDRAESVHRLGGRALARRAEVDERVAAAAAAQWARAGTDREALTEIARWSSIAGRAAARGLSPEGAAGHFARAAEALRRVGAPPAQLADTLIALAEAHYLRGDYPAALATSEEGAVAADTAQRSDLVAAAALVVRWVTYPQAATVVLRLASEALTHDGLPASTRARLLAQLATMNADEGRSELARSQAATALELAERDGDPQALTDAARSREVTLAGVLDGDERLRLGDLVVRHGTALGQPVSVVLGHEWRLRAGYERARLSLVEDAVGAIGIVAERIGLPLVTWHQFRVSAAVAALEGRFAAAREANDGARAIALVTGDVTAAGLSMAYAHQLARLRGDPREILPGTEDLLDRLPPQPILTLARAQLALDDGRREEARSRYRRLRAVVDDPPVGDPRWPAVALAMVELAATFGDVGCGRALLPQLQAYHDCPGIEGVPTVYFTGSPRRELGNLLALLERLDEAVDELRAALEVDTSLGARPFAVVCRLDLASVLLRRGGVAGLREADAHAKVAAAEARRLDMPGSVVRADAVIRDVATARRAVDVLSGREREVAELLRDGLTNRQIADRLVISERTVESHVSSVLRKAGVGSRVEYLTRQPDDERGRSRLS